MTFGLAPGISFGASPDATVVLDLYRDRYSLLGPAAARALTALARGEPVVDGDQIGLAALQRSAIIVSAASAVPVSGIETVSPALSALEIGDVEAARLGLAAVIRAVVAVHVSLNLRGLAGSIDRMRHARGRRRLDDDTARAVAVAQGYARHRPLIPLARSCVPETLALSLLLTRWSIAHDVLFGVRLAPFAAHAWAQTATHILTDRADPIAGLMPVFRL